MSHLKNWWHLTLAGYSGGVAVSTLTADLPTAVNITGTVAGAISIGIFVADRMSQRSARRSA